jgi:hypothetical protein
MNMQQDDARFKYDGMVRELANAQKSIIDALTVNTVRLIKDEDNLQRNEAGFIRIALSAVKSVAQTAHARIEEIEGLIAIQASTPAPRSAPRPRRQPARAAAGHKGQARIATTKRRGAKKKR